MDFSRIIGKIFFSNAAKILMVSVILSAINLPNSQSSELKFIDKTREAGLSYLPSHSFGVSWGDFNDDNLIDLYINNHYMYAPSLFKNSGNGTFEDITEQAGLNIPGDYHGASWGDFDNDGDRDLYSTLGASSGKGLKSNYLFLNNGNDSFKDIAKSGGVEDAKGRGRTPVWFDYDSDGRLDLFIANAERVDAASVLLKNNGNLSFTNVTENAGLEDITHAIGAYVADINGDGLLDLIISAQELIVGYRNNGDGTFDKISQDLQASNIGTIYDLALGDYDNDGDIDIFVAKGQAEMNDGYEANIDKMNSRVWVKDYEKGFSLEVNNFSVVEFDLFIFQEKVSTNLVYIGSNKYHPNDIPFSLDPAFSLNHGEPIRTGPGVYIWFDLSENEWHTRYVGDGVNNTPVNGVISAPGSIGQVRAVNLKIDTNNYRNTLLQNLGDGQFIDVTENVGLGHYIGDAKSAVFADFDNDGDLDVYVVYTGIIFNDVNKLFENDGQGHFTDVAASAGAQALVEGRGDSAAVADYNNDGFLDIIIQNGRFEVGQRVLLQNQTKENKWLQIKLIGRISNRDGIGAIVELEAESVRITKQCRGGMHTFSQNSKILQYGLGNEEIVDRITIRWPSGIVQRLCNIDVNQRLVVEEPLVSLTLIPDRLTVPRGGAIGIQVTAANHTSEYQQFLFGTNVNLPNGDIYPPLPDLLFGPVWVSLAPYGTVYDLITHDVSIDAPIGQYVYSGAIGKQPWIIWNEDHFEFTVVPSSAE